MRSCIHNDAHPSFWRRFTRDRFCSCVIALCKLLGDRIKSNSDFILVDTIGVLSGRSARGLSFRMLRNLFFIVCNKAGFLFGTEALGNAVGNCIDPEIAAAPVRSMSSEMLSGSKYARIFSKLLASGNCISRSRSWQTNVAEIDFSW